MGWPSRAEIAILQMIDGRELRQILSQAAPTLSAEIAAKTVTWTRSVLARLDTRKPDVGFPKTFNDPVWGEIILYPWETLIQDSLLLQRLRGVRQLGMAHLVYPGAGYDRLEHSRGVVEAAERMMRSLSRNASFRMDFGRDRDKFVPPVSRNDEISIRLAALLHDVGHGAFSHATEPLIQSRFADEFARAANELRSRFSGVTTVAPAEVIAVLVVISEAMTRVFEHPMLGATAQPALLPVSIAARILGSRDYLDATYLSGIVSGPLDADKLDYMARDCHHAGLRVGLDLHRLISKLEVVTVTPDTAPNHEMRDRAERSPNKRFHELGISLNGLTAYEQMIIGRVILYDRLYYHHKVRAAEGMVRALIVLAEEERGAQFTLGELFYDLPDDTVIAALGGQVRWESFKEPSKRTASLATAIQNRLVYYRAFAFAPRFIAGLQGLPEKERQDARALVWTNVLNKLSTIDGCQAVATEIYENARQVREQLPEARGEDGDFLPEHVVVDLPVNTAVVRGSDILTRTEDGSVGTPNLFFDPERWSQAYEHQKQCGFVFTPRQFVRPVAVAARAVFFESFQLVVGSAADRASKTAGEIEPNWFLKAAELGLCTKDCAAAYGQDVPVLTAVRASDLEVAIPDAMKRDDPRLADRLCQQFAEAFPFGLPPSVHNVVVAGVEHLLNYLSVVAQTGEFVGRDSLAESELQRHLRGHLLARGAEVAEGLEVGGGETDLVLSNLVVIENKVLGQSRAPLTDGRSFPWQARRYSIPLCTRIAFEVVAYKPHDETSILPLSESIAVTPIPNAKDGFGTVRVVVPWGHEVPSRAKPPKPP